ncbi:MAG: hypothetical protein ACK2VD_21760, partial [Anaerolineae bacterium]
MSGSPLGFGSFAAVRNDVEMMVGNGAGRSTRLDGVSGRYGMHPGERVRSWGHDTPDHGWRATTAIVPCATIHSTASRIAWK